MGQETDNWTGKAVKIIDDSEFFIPDGGSLEGKTGEVIGTIPPKDKNPNPHRLMVQLDGGPIVNFRPGDVETIEEKK